MFVMVHGIGPEGYDESKISGCNNYPRKCINMFKCHDSQICVPFGNICDEQFDCKLGDDENLCSLWNVNCPMSCKCLMFSLSCNNSKTIANIPSAHFPFLFGKYY